jgi:hypothetical protein
MSGKIISALDSALNKGRTPGEGGAPIIPSHYNPDPSGATMKAAQWWVAPAKWWMLHEAAP